MISSLQVVGSLAATVFTAMLAGSSWAESPKTSGCLPQIEFEPHIIANTDLKVTFRCEDATALDLIRAAGRQTRIPIRVVLGGNTDFLTVRHSYNLEHVDAKGALLIAIEGSGYSLEERAGVMVLLAGDLSFRQREILAYKYDDFPSGGRDTMVDLAFRMTTWMRAAADPSMGSGGSILGRTNDEQISIHLARSATTEEIANEIVRQGSRGMWIFKVDKDRPSSLEAMTDEIDIEPYQHYTNDPSGYNVSSPIPRLKREP